MAAISHGRIIGITLRLVIGATLPLLKRCYHWLLLEILVMSATTVIIALLLLPNATLVVLMPLARQFKSAAAFGWLLNSCRRGCRWSLVITFTPGLLSLPVYGVVRFVLLINITTLILLPSILPIASLSRDACLP